MKKIKKLKFQNDVNLEIVKSSLDFVREGDLFKVVEKVNEIIDVLNGMPDFNPKREPISGKNIVQKLNKKGGD